MLSWFMVNSIIRINFIFSVLRAYEILIYNFFLDNRLIKIKAMNIMMPLRIHIKKIDTVKMKKTVSGIQEGTLKIAQILIQRNCPQFQYKIT